MCGIAGFVTVNPSDSPSIIERMTDTIRHRGPDDFGYYRDPWASLGFRRLAIIDLSGGHQPMANEDQSLVHHLQRRDLQPRRLCAPRWNRPAIAIPTAPIPKPSSTPTNSTAPIASSASAACSPSPSGIRTRASLFCARDRLGKKPLYYYWDGRVFAFASEIKALFEHPAISPQFEDSLLPEYLAFGYVSEERTLFRGIRKLMPGHHLTLDLAAP